MRGKKRREEEEGRRRGKRRGEGVNARRREGEQMEE